MLETTVLHLLMSLITLLVVQPKMMINDSYQCNHKKELDLLCEQFRCMLQTTDNNRNKNKNMNEAGDWDDDHDDEVQDVTPDPESFEYNVTNGTVVNVSDKVDVQKAVQSIISATEQANLMYDECKMSKKKPLV